MERVAVAISFKFAYCFLGTVLDKRLEAALLDNGC